MRGALLAVTMLSLLVVGGACGDKDDGGDGTGDGGATDGGAGDGGTDGGGGDGGADGGTDGGTGDGGADGGMPTGCGDLELTDLGATLVCIEPGSFFMGCTKGQVDCGKDESPAHEVTLTHKFWLGETEVTQDQWIAVSEPNPSTFNECGGGCPVESITWNEMAQWLNDLSDAEGYDRCYSCSDGFCEVAGSPYDCSGFRLPTEAEWEFAARCGDDLPYAGSETPGPVAWFSGNAKKQTHPAGVRAPNACGLYDMSGNVWEFTQDFYQAYTEDSVVDPTGAGTGEHRVRRGGGYDGGSTVVRTSKRYRSGQDFSNDNTGFRIARTVPAGR